MVGPAWAQPARRNSGRECLPELVEVAVARWPWSNPSRMPDPQSAETIRAVVETLLPAAEGRTGGLDLRADEHVVQQVELYLPGFSDMAAALFDAYAAGVRAGASFVGLSED